ncbi:MerR family transcriptional regulator [Clostridium sp.]|uniref:MerR family transcriptional regulator n=1 Tax=Clostridium sp. TaxID=1506 RepID=UPI002608CF89|nr:MerR family transcriptional regulator [Clostridium sp.]
MKNRFSIGEVSNMFKVSIHTLRYYDKIGLLKPIINEKNRYRYYEPKHIHQLSIILGSRYLGIHIEDIKEIFESGDINRYYSLLNDQEKLIDEKILNLKHLKKRVKSSKERINNIKFHENIYDIKSLNIVYEKRNILFVKSDLILENHEFKRFMNSIEIDGINSEYYYKGSFNGNEMVFPLDSFCILKNDENNELFEIIKENSEGNNEFILEGNFVELAFLGTIKEVKNYIKNLPKIWINGKDSLIFVNERSYLLSKDKAKYYFNIIIFFK